MEDWKVSLFLLNVWKISKLHCKTVERIVSMKQLVDDEPLTYVTRASAVLITTLPWASTPVFLKVGGTAPCGLWNESGGR